jgi:hypothetical protein
LAWRIVHDTGPSRLVRRGEFNWGGAPRSIAGSRPPIGHPRDRNASSPPSPRAVYEVIGVFQETASGAELDRNERRKAMALAQRREIDAVLVTELSAWFAARSTCCTRSSSWKPAACR